MSQRPPDFATFHDPDQFLQPDAFASVWNETMLAIAVVGDVISGATARLNE